MAPAPRRILITGANGFLGGSVLAALGEHWPEARLLALYLGGSPLAGAESLEVDLCDPDAAAVRRVRDFEPDTLYHLAGCVRGSAESLYRINLGATVGLLRSLADLASLERVLLAGSTSVYGPVPAEELPVAEGRAPDPRDDYAITKLAQELLVRDWCRERDCGALVCRISNPIGAGQGDDFFVGGLARQFAAIAAGRQESRLEVWHLAGSRDFIDVRDLAAALASLGGSSRSEILHVAGGSETPLRTVVETFQALVNRAVEVVETRPPRPDQILRQCVDVSRLRERVGGEPARRPLRETLAWMLEAAGSHKEA